MMNGVGGMLQPGAPQPVLTRARFLLNFVDATIDATLTMATGNSVTVSESTLVAWQTLLSTVVNMLSSLPVPLIEPPPRWAQLVGVAINNINAALQILAGIPVASPRIFPPRPGQATVNVETLRRVQVNIRMAVQAILAAQSEIGGA